MGEIVYKVVDGPVTKDGDCVFCLSDRRIKFTNANQICHHGNAGFKSDNLRPDGLGRDFLASISRKQYRRISRRECELTQTDYAGNIISQETITEFTVPNYDKDREHMVFGTPSREVWFKGPLDMTQAATDWIWSNIIDKTDHDPHWKMQKVWQRSHCLVLMAPETL